jgi:hypothetical protein
MNAQNYIQSVADLQETARASASFPFKQLIPYMEDAFQRFILPYLGERLHDRLSSIPAGEGSEREQEVRRLIARALGPLSLALASPELGVVIGDSGHLVKRNGDFAAANLDKIERAERGLRDRGFLGIEILLSYLKATEADFAEWADSDYIQRLTRSLWIADGREMMRYSSVIVDHPQQSFFCLVPMVESLQESLRARIGADLYDQLLESYKADTLDLSLEGMVKLIKEWITVKLEIAQLGKTDEQPEPTVPLVFTPRFRPMNRLSTDWCLDRLTFLEANIDRLAAEMSGTTDSLGHTSNMNSKDLHIFVL